MRLAECAAIVTGGGVRLGRAIALALADHGAKVAVHYNTSRDGAEQVVAEIRGKGREASAIQGDLARPGEATRVLTEAAGQLGRLDILVNSAALYKPGGLAQTSESLWDEHFAVNLKAPFFLSQAFAAHVGRERRGHILNIADASVNRPAAGYLAYRQTKAALLHLTRDLAIALAPNIQVNAIAPGAILPPPGKDEDYMRELAKTIPAMRVGSIDEIVKAMLYLLQSDFVTGEVIYVSGGAHL